MVSVIIPTYNREGPIKKAAESVLKQTYSNLELLIVDDCSTDNTKAVIQELNDSRVKYICLEKNSGACVARNVGISNAQGDLIAFHDSDDIWHENKLEEQIKCFDNDNVDVVFCKMFNINEKGKNTGVIANNFKEGMLNKSSDVLGISTQTIIGRKRVFDNIKFDEAMPRLQDFDLMMRIIEKYNVYCLDQPLVDYFMCDDSISKNPIKLYKACLIFKSKYPHLRVKYKFTSKTFANVLLDGTMNLSSDAKKEKNQICELALFYSHSFKVLIKIILTKLNILSLYVKYRNR